MAEQHFVMFMRSGSSVVRHPWPGSRGAGSSAGTCHAEPSSFMTNPPSRGLPLSEKLCLKYLAVVEEGNTIAPPNSGPSNTKANTDMCQREQSIKHGGHFLPQSCIANELEEKAKEGKEEEDHSSQYLNSNTLSCHDTMTRCQQAQWENSALKYLGP